ncbi:MAG: glycosyltransferase, partial [Acidimicrobiales bacterium]|nr:glycosyltransferase [Acidimicrobiales bacterium]
SWLVGVVPGALGAALAGRKRDALAFVAGAAAVVAAVGLVVPFGEFWRWTFTNNGGFVTVGAALGPTAGRFAATVATFVAFHLALVALVAVATRRRWADRASWRADLDLWLWLATGLVAVVAGLRFFGHYWLQALPPAVLLAAPVAARLAPRVQRWTAAAVAVPTAVAVAFAWTPTTFRTLPDPGPLARYVRAHTRPGQPVLIWGSFPEVYWAADRPPGGALVHSDFVTGLSGGRPAGRGTVADATPGAARVLLTQLRDDPPALVLDTSTTDLRHYGAYPIRDFPDLDRFLRARYREVARVRGVRVLAPR